MTPSEMLTLLGYRLEDPNGDVYDNTLKILMINRAQNRVYTELNPHVVPELQSVESNLALDVNGAFSTGDLTNTVLGGISGGVYAVKLVGYNFSRKMSFDEYKQSVDRDVTFTSDRPRHYIIGSSCYVLPDDYDIDVYYKTKPIQITQATSGTLVTGVEYVITTFAVGDSFTSSGAASNATGVVFTYNGVAPTWSNGSTVTVNEFTVENENVHDAIAFYAESLLWGVNNDSRKGDALQEASSLIETLNTTITATDSNSIDDKEYLDYDSEYSLPLSSWEI